MQRVERATVVTRVTRSVEDAIGRLEAVAERSGVELCFDGGEPAGSPDLAVVLGGDGTMLRALARFLDTGVPVMGVNFGRVGFLSAVDGDELEAGLERAFSGDYAVQSLPTLEVELDGGVHVAVNDVAVVSGTPGRIVELDYALGGEDLGSQPCDGVICATPPGSTAYNLSNGGPVLVWGLDAAVITFIAPHTLHARPLVVAPDFRLDVVNRTAGVEAVMLIDGHPVTSLECDAGVSVRFGSSRTLLVTMPEQTFFGRYAAVFGTG
jgi:NAD+ kinase